VLFDLVEAEVALGDPFADAVAVVDPPFDEHLGAVRGEQAGGGGRPGAGGGEVEGGADVGGGVEDHVAGPDGGLGAGRVDPDVGDGAGHAGAGDHGVRAPDGAQEPLGDRSHGTGMSSGAPTRSNTSCQVGLAVIRSAQVGLLVITVAQSTAEPTTS